MAKYNITERQHKDVAYRKMISKKVMEEMKDRIYDVIVRQKKYLDKDYSARKLAEDLNTNSRYISGVTNVMFKMNYASLVNGYRIKDAMAILADEKYIDASIEQVGFMVGFANRQSFYASFYRILGITPNEYRVSMLGGGPVKEALKKKLSKGEKQKDGKE